MLTSTNARQTTLLHDEPFAAASLPSALLILS
jgi:hypothetical protein